MDLVELETMDKLSINRKAEETRRPDSLTSSVAHRGPQSSLVETTSRNAPVFRATNSLETLMSV